MKIHQFSVEEALASLHSHHEGLSLAEAQRRLKEYGRNEVEVLRGEKLAIRLLKEFTHFFALILWLAAGLAFFAEAKQPGSGMATIGLCHSWRYCHQRRIFVLATVPGRAGDHRLAKAVATHRKGLTRR